MELRLFFHVIHILSLIFMYFITFPFSYDQHTSCIYHYICNQPLSGIWRDYLKAFNFHMGCTRFKAKPLGQWWSCPIYLWCIFYSQNPKVPFTRQFLICFAVAIWAWFIGGNGRWLCYPSTFQWFWLIKKPFLIQTGSCSTHYSITTSFWVQRIFLMVCKTIHF